jgi:signal transduction histidine kinase
MSAESLKPTGPVIIIADDRRASRHMIRNILASGGYNIYEAANGAEALELFSAVRPDLVLLDIVMPVMDGLEACRQLKQLEGGEHVPVLMFTAYDEGKQVEKAFQAGASDFINKPINPEELRHRVKRLLHLRSLELERRAAEEELQASYITIQSLSRKVLNAHEEEKSHLARELHDEIGMTLTTLKLNLQLLNKDLSAGGCNQGEKMASIIDLINDLQGAIRNKAVFLRPPALSELGLAAVLGSMVKDLKQHTSLQAELQANGDCSEIPIEVEGALYRCIQEALTNVSRHASAEKVSVKLECSEGRVTVRITDDGIGFDPGRNINNERHLGLQGMRERVELLSGKIAIGSSPGMGTDIRITIPLSGN